MEFQLSTICLTQRAASHNQSDLSEHKQMHAENQDMLSFESFRCDIRAEDVTLFSRTTKAEHRPVTLLLFILLLNN